MVLEAIANYFEVDRFSLPSARSSDDVFVADSRKGRAGVDRAVQVEHGLSVFVLYPTE